MIANLFSLGERNYINNAVLRRLGAKIGARPITK
jgi:hypothetical protein